MNIGRKKYVLWNSIMSNCRNSEENCFSAQNFTEIGKSATELRPKTIFNLAAVRRLEFILKSFILTTWQSTSLKTAVPNFIKSGDFSAISRFSRWWPSWICWNVIVLDDGPTTFLIFYVVWFGSCWDTSHRVLRFSSGSWKLISSLPAISATESLTHQLTVLFFSANPLIH